MAKRQSDSQLTKDEFEANEGAREGGPDSTVDPVKLASSDVMKKRAIKQPKSRFSTSSTSRPAVPENTFSFGTQSSTPTQSTAPTNGASPFGKFNNASAPFPGFSPSTNGHSTNTAHIPAQKSPTKPFGSLNSSTTPTGKPPAGLGLLGSIGPGNVAPPKLGGSGLFGSSGSTNNTNNISSAQTPEVKRTSNPFSVLGSPGTPLFGAKTGNSTTNSNSISAAADNKPKQYTGGLFGSSSNATNTISTSSSSSLFGSPAKMSNSNSTTPASTFQFANSANANDSAAKPAALKPAISLNANFTSSATPSAVSYPSLPSAPPSVPASTTASIFSVSSTSTSPATSNPSPVQFDIKVPPPPSNFSPFQTEEYERLYKLKSLNESFKKILSGADGFGDFRDVCNFYTKVVGEILNQSGSGGKRKDGDELKSAGESPKRVKTDTERNMSSSGGSAAKLFGDILDKAVGSSAQPQKEPEVKGVTIDPCAVGDGSGKDKWSQKASFEFKPPSANYTPAADSNKPIEKPVFKPFVPPTANKSSQSGSLFGISKPTATPETVKGSNMFGNSMPETSNGSNLFGNSTTSAPPTTSQPMASSSFPSSSTGTSLFQPQSKPMSNLFGSAGGESAGGAVGGGLFGHLKPTLSSEKDKGEEDEDDHQSSNNKISTSGGLFGPPGQTAPIFKFSTPDSSSNSNPQTGGSLFNKPAGGDYTWTTGSPIRFGNSTASDTSSAPAAPFTFTPSTNAFQPNSNVGFSFGGNGTSSAGSRLTQPLSRNPSFEGAISANTSGLSTPAGATPAAGTPGPDSDQDNTSSSRQANTNEPSDEVATTGSDWSGKGPGEEDEDVLFTVRCAVYHNGSGTMNKAGVGALRVLSNRTTKKKRILVRTEAGKVIMNVAVNKHATYAPKSSAMNTVPIPSYATQGPKMYIVKIKKNEDAKLLADKLEEIKGH